MTFRLIIFLFLASLTLAASVVEARVHRRSVGPVILDLGSLPPLPVTTSDTRPPVAAGNLPSPPQVDGTPETGVANPGPFEVRAIYPSHAQPLGALVLTRQPAVEPVKEITSSVLFTDPEREAPVLIAYYHPTLTGDHALLSPPVDSAPTPVVTTEPPPAQPARELKDDLKAEAETTPPAERLRTLVIWIWRLLFYAGVGALTGTLWRRRRGQPGQPESSPPVEKVADPEFSEDLTGSRVLRTSGAGEEKVVDNISLMTEKTGAAITPDTRLRAFGLIEPGAARPATPGGAPTRDKDRRRP